jgi:hypothetical protein
MRIVFEDVSEELALQLAELLAAHGLQPARTEPSWTAARAEALLRDLPTFARELIRRTVAGNGWCPADELRHEGETLRGRTGPITQAITRGIKADRFPEGLPVPVSAVYDPDVASYQKTKGFAMPEEHLDAFRAAVEHLDGEPS